jgi:hypothetical protein
MMGFWVRFPVLPFLPWRFFPEGEDSHGDYGLGSLVELRFMASPGPSYSWITIHLIRTMYLCLMGVPTSEVGYSSAITGRGEHKVHKGHVMALPPPPQKKKIIYIKLQLGWHLVAAVQHTFTQNTENGIYITINKLNIHNNKKLTNVRSVGRAPALRVIPWHLPYNWGKSMEKPQLW